MKSKTSCFKTLFLSAVKRSWPVWTAYLAVWLVYLCGSIASGLTRNWDVLYYGITEYITFQLVLEMAVHTGVFISFFAAIASAMCVFSFMYNSRSAGAMASLPIKREKLYFAQAMAGLVPLLIANVIIFAAGLCVELNFGAVDIVPMLSWLAIVSMQLVIFFGIAAFSAQLTGHIVVLPAAYVVFNFTAAVLEYAVKRASCVFVYGASMGKGVLTALSPLVYMVGNMYISVPSVADANGAWTMQYAQAYFVGWTGMLVYLAVGVVLLFLGMLLYKYRRIEAVGDVVSVKILKPVFKYCFALGGALGLGVYAHSILKDLYYTDGSVWELLLLMLLGGFICYFVAEMMIKKSFHIWKAKAFVGFAVFAVVLAAFACAGEFDLFGYEARVPSADDVVSVTVGGSSERVELTDIANIERVISLHRQVLSNKEENEAYIKSGGYINSYYGVIMLELEYELKNGGTIRRVYNITAPYGDIEAFETLINCQEAIDYRKQTLIPVTPDTIGYAVVNYREEGAVVSDYYYDMETLYLTAAEAYELYTECILPDIADGTLGRIWLVLDKDYYDTVYNCSISLELRQKRGSGELEYDYFYTVPTVDSLRTNAWLTEHGVELTFYDYGEQLDPVTGEVISYASASDIVID